MCITAASRPMGSSTLSMARKGARSVTGGSTTGTTPDAPGRRCASGAADTLTEAARELRRYAEHIDLDPLALTQAEARIAAVQDAARKFRLKPEALPEYLAAAAAQLSQLGAACDLEALTRAETEAEASSLRPQRSHACAAKPPAA